MAKEVDARMAEWRRKKQSQQESQQESQVGLHDCTDQPPLRRIYCHPLLTLSWLFRQETQRGEGLTDGSLCGDFGPAVDLAGVPPPSLLVAQLLPGQGLGQGEKKRRSGGKKKRRRHSRKPKAEGPFGGPAEWVGREGNLPVLQVPREVLAALEEKNARKAENHARRVALRTKNARIAAVEQEQEEQEAQQQGQQQQHIQQQQHGLQGEGGVQQAARPRLKYLPKIEPGTKPPPSPAAQQLAELTASRVSYVDNLWD
jgi:hypothetical protein